MVQPIVRYEQAIACMVIDTYLTSSAVCLIELDSSFHKECTYSDWSLNTFQQSET